MVRTYSAGRRRYGFSTRGVALAAFEEVCLMRRTKNLETTNSVTVKKEATPWRLNVFLQESTYPAVHAEITRCIEAHGEPGLFAPAACRHWFSGEWQSADGARSFWEEPALRR